MRFAFAQGSWRIPAQQKSLPSCCLLLVAPAVQNSGSRVGIRLERALLAVARNLGVGIAFEPSVPLLCPLPRNQCVAPIPVADAMLRSGDDAHNEPRISGSAALKRPGRGRGSTVDGMPGQWTRACQCLLRSQIGLNHTSLECAPKMIQDRMAPTSH